jgi:hypothetical protein
MLARKVRTPCFPFLVWSNNLRRESICDVSHFFFIGINNMRCPKPRVHEKQVSMMCGKHAINNLLQTKRATTCGCLSTVAQNLSNRMDIPLEELMNNETGHYDMSVLVAFLNQEGYETEQIARRNFHKMSHRQSYRLLGYIFGDGAHWMAVRKMRSFGCYFEIDSLHNTHRPVHVLKEWLRDHPEKIVAIKVLRPRRSNVSVGF